MGTTLRYQNYIQEEIKSILISGSAVRFRTFCRQAATYLKRRKTIILPVILYGYETSLLRLGEEQKSRLSDNRSLR